MDGVEEAGPGHTGPSPAALRPHYGMWSQKWLLISDLKPVAPSWTRVQEDPPRLHQLNFPYRPKTVESTPTPHPPPPDVVKAPIASERAALCSIYIPLAMSEDPKATPSPLVPVSVTEFFPLCFKPYSKSSAPGWQVNAPNKAVQNHPFWGINAGGQTAYCAKVCTPEGISVPSSSGPQAWSDLGCALTCPTRPTSTPCWSRHTSPDVVPVFLL